MIKYYIPDFYDLFHVNTKLLNLIKNEPQMFYDDFEIGAIFGNFPNCIWNGGSNIEGAHTSFADMTYIFNNFNTLGVPIRLTMTNPLIEKKHLQDSYANYIMQNCYNGINQVLVASPILEKYIRKNYPKYPIVKSIISSENIYYDDSDKYYMSVLRKHKNNDFNLLKSIKNKNKIELLINETCEENCPRAYSHYSEHAKKQLYLDNQE
jgi:hypothetical protein